MGALKGAYPTAVDNDVLQNLFNFQCLSLDYTLIESYAEHPSDPASSMTTSTTMAYWERNYFVTLTLGYQMCFTSPISLYCVLYCISMPTAMSEVKARLSREGKNKNWRILCVCGCAREREKMHVALRVFVKEHRIWESTCELGLQVLHISIGWAEKSLKG